MGNRETQLELVPAVPMRRGRASSRPQSRESAAGSSRVAAAADNHVARVIVDSPLAHLDRAFDYAVPADLDELVVAGCRVKVRFAGRLMDGFCIERLASSDHQGKLAFLAKAVSPEPVLKPEILALARSVAARQAGTVADVLRLAVPPRHARTEAKPSAPPESPLGALDPWAWRAYRSGDHWASEIQAGRSPRAVFSALPGHDPAELVAQAVLAMLHTERGSAVCVPDARTLAEWHEVFARVLGPGHHVLLTASQTPAERYKSFLALARGAVKVVLGTRGAAFAPVQQLGLVAMWDEGDDLYAELRAPYPHAREVLLQRAVDSGAGVLIGGYARTAEAQLLVDSGWCGELAPDAAVRRDAWPVLTVTDGSVAGGAPSRLPSEVFRAIRSTDGAVLVQVPRRGYRASLSCQQCGTSARCPQCHGPMGQMAPNVPVSCRWCAHAEPSWTCAECGSSRLRAPVVGQLRTAEEYARAFPEHRIQTSSGGNALSGIEPAKTIVLATPGAEPRVDGGYRLVVLMDTWLMFAREDMRVIEESHRRWFNALALAGRGAPAIAVGDSGALQALVRADPVGLAQAELADRQATHLPPVGRLAIIGAPSEVLASLAQHPWTPHTEVLGPVPTAEAERLILRAPRSEGLALTDKLKEVQSQRSREKLPPLRIQVDPLSF